MIHTRDQIYQVSSAPLTGEKKKKAYEVVNLHAVFSRWDIPNMKREQSMKLLHGYILCACSRQRHRKMT